MTMAREFVGMSTEHFESEGNRPGLILAYLAQEPEKRGEWLSRPILESQKSKFHWDGLWDIAAYPESTEGHRWTA